MFHDSQNFLRLNPGSCIKAARAGKTLKPVMNGGFPIKYVMKSPNGREMPGLLGFLRTLSRGHGTTYQRGVKMKVRDLMTTNAVSCRPDTNLAAVGALMWEHDCGLIPVVDDTERVSGVITDRDICIALSTRDKQPSRITAREITTAPAFVCSPDDDIQAALITMSRERLHRLPVVNRDRGLVGILSINDVVSHAEKSLGKRPGISYEDVVQTLQAICSHPKGTVHAMAH